VGEKEEDVDENGIPMNLSEEERKYIFEESRIVSRQVCVVSGAVCCGVVLCGDVWCSVL